jgi:hypothetical protein
MRKTIAMFLVTALLSSSAPLMIRDRGGDPGERFVRIIKTIIRHLLPIPTDDGTTINPPKP